MLELLQVLGKRPQEAANQNSIRATEPQVQRTLGTQLHRAFGAQATLITDLQVQHTLGMLNSQTLSSDTIKTNLECDLLKVVEMMRHRVEESLTTPRFSTDDA